jgi:hypothetical protein
MGVCITHRRNLLACARGMETGHTHTKGLRTGPWMAILYGTLHVEMAMDVQRYFERVQASY